MFCVHVAGYELGTQSSIYRSKSATEYFPDGQSINTALRTLILAAKENVSPYRYANHSQKEATK
jgi:hypothetical protein